MPAARSEATVPTVAGHPALAVPGRSEQGRGGVAAPDRRGVPLLPAGCGEPLPGVAVHRVGRRRRVRRLHDAVPADFAYALPGGYPPAELAPLLCAGIIGYRALRRAELPAGGKLGIYGFGASAHLTAQVAIARGARVHVLTRSPQARELALELGVASAGGAADAPPEPLDAAILFAPAGGLVPVALRALDRGGTLAIAGIHLSEIPALDYERELFQERTVRSVTANTRQDGRELLDFAARHRLRVAVTPYPMHRAADALVDLAADRVTGAAVLLP